MIAIRSLHVLCCLCLLLGLDATTAGYKYDESGNESSSKEKTNLRRSLGLQQTQQKQQQDGVVDQLRTIRRYLDEGGDGDGQGQEETATEEKSEEGTSNNSNDDNSNNNDNKNTVHNERDGISPHKEYESFGKGGHDDEKKEQEEPSSEVENEDEASSNNNETEELKEIEEEFEGGNNDNNNDNNNNNGEGTTEKKQSDNNKEDGSASKNENNDESDENGNENGEGKKDDEEEENNEAAPPTDKPTEKPKPETTTTESPTQSPVVSPTDKPTEKPYVSSPPDDNTYDPIKAEDEKQAEEEEVQALEKELNQEEKVARRAGGLGIFLGIVVMIFTAYQMSENPDGIYASVCRLAITISTVAIKIVCMPCRKLIGGVGTNGSPHYNGHMPISTNDYSYRNDPYRSNANAGFELT